VVVAPNSKLKLSQPGFVPGLKGLVIYKWPSRPRDFGTYAPGRAA